MTSAFTFEKLGVVFGYDETGKAFFQARSDVVQNAVLEEIERRCALILPQLPLKPMQMARVVEGRDAKRWGECMMCLEPMKAHVGGTCALCNGGLRMAFRKFAESQSPSVTTAV